MCLADSSAVISLRGQDYHLCRVGISRHMSNDGAARRHTSATHRIFEPVVPSRVWLHHCLILVANCKMESCDTGARDYSLLLLDIHPCLPATSTTIIV